MDTFLDDLDDLSKNDPPLRLGTSGGSIFFLYQGSPAFTLRASGSFYAANKALFSLNPNWFHLDLGCQSRTSTMRTFANHASPRDERPAKSSKTQLYATPEKL